MKKETCRLCSKYKTKSCESLTDREGKKFICPNFTGDYATVRISAEKTILTPIPKNKKYGLSVKLLRKLLKSQNGKCAICERVEYLVLDHNHLTGQARGYLCRTCNTKLSGFDSPIFADKAREYLDNPPANKLSE